MDKTGKFLLPSPKFEKLDKSPAQTPHFLSPQGMLLPKEKQPPPMYGPRGSTVPPKFIVSQRESSVAAGSNQHERPQKYFCEPCEAEFHTATDFKVHRSEHTHCEIGDCTFRGHPSFMDTHITQQHSTGLYDQLKKLNTPEEIAQWRADRKKNYPTVAVVEQKWKAREQRMLRGEKLEGNKKRFGRDDDRRQMGNDKNKEVREKSAKSESKKRQRKRNRGAEKKGDREVDKKGEVSEPAVVEKENNEEPTCGGLKMFKGTAGMTGYMKIKKPETHALSSLLGMYGSDSEEENESVDEKEQIDTTEQASLQPIEEDNARNTDPTNESTEEIPLAAKDTFCSNDEPMDEVILEAQLKEELEKSTEKRYDIMSVDPDSSNEDAPEEAPIEKSCNIPDKPQTEPPQKKMKRDPPKKQPSKSGLDYRKLRGGRQNTMLEKLLEPDIRHERNVLLQCVRFVVENNFFGIGSSSQ